MYKLLIADDEQIERDALKAIINKCIDSIIDIQEAVNGREAIVKAGTFHPDIVFLDIKMPGINGIEAARTIRSLSPTVSIVFLTAFSQFEYAQEAIQIGVDDFIIKPSSETKTLEVLLKILKKIDINRLEENKNRNNEIKLTRVTAYMENEFVYNLAVNGISQEKFENYLAILDKRFHTGRAGIVKLLYETYPIKVDSNYQKKVLMKRTSFIIKSIFAKEGILTLFNTELSNIYFVAIREIENTTNGNNFDIRDLNKTISYEIKNTLNLNVLTGFGSIFNNPGKSLKSFSHAKIMLANRSGGKETSNTENEAGPMALDVEIDMEEAILSGNRENTLKTLHILKEWFESTKLIFEVKKKSILELATVLKHAAAYQLPKGKCIIDETSLNEAHTSEDLLSGLNMLLNELLEQVAAAKEIENSPAIKSACKFIKNNYTRDITLEDTAKQCRLSSFYFSKLFKRKKGITFIEYLTLQRIKEAKKMLEENNLSIKEISGRIGYSDPNYFTKVFKKIESISPSTYRNNKLL